MLIMLFDGRWKLSPVIVAGVWYDDKSALQCLTSHITHSKLNEGRDHGPRAISPAVTHELEL